MSRYNHPRYELTLKLLVGVVLASAVFVVANTMKVSTVTVVIGGLSIVSLAYVARYLDGDSE